MKTIIKLNLILILALNFNNSAYSQSKIKLLFDEVSTALHQAKSAHADILCKERYNSAVENYGMALELMNEKDESSDIVEYLENSISEITLLNESIEQKYNFFYNVLKLREKAIENEANKNAEYFFNEGDLLLSSAIAYYEDGEYESVRNELPIIQNHYNNSINYADLSRSLQYKWLPYNSATEVWANVIAPNEFNKGMSHFNSALILLNDGKDMVEIEGEIISAEENFNTSIITANKFRSRYPSIISARQEALTANADQLAFPHWYLAEEMLVNLAENELEEEMADVAETAEIIAQYHLAESEAYKFKFLSEANNKLDNARQLNADNYTPISYSNSSVYINRASEIIENDNFNSYQITRLADESIKEANKAIFISKIIQSVEAGETTWEDVLLSWNNVIKSKSTASKIKISEDIIVPEPEPEYMEVPIHNENIIDYNSIFTDEEAELVEENERLTIHLIGLNFEPIRTELEFSHREILDKAILKMQQYPTASFNIIGNTDNIGLRADNQKISEKRAKNVYDYFVKNSGISSYRFSHSGQGEMNPIADNRTHSGRQKNRRVDLIINYNE